VTPRTGLLTPGPFPLREGELRHDDVRRETPRIKLTTDREHHTNAALLVLL